MGFLDTLERITNDLLKGLSPEQVTMLRSCKTCNFYKEGYCTQTPAPTKILSLYQAQACIYYSPEQITTGRISETERETAGSLLDRVKLVDLANVDIVAQTVGNIGIDIMAQTVGSIDVNISSSAVTLDVNIESSAVTLNVAIQSSAVTLDVNIKSSDITLNVAIQSSAVTLNVNIQSQAVDINIKTNGGANIVIDKLVQGAYTDRRTAIENRGTTASGDITENIWGKFFSRGCLGHLRRIGAFVTNTSGSDADIVLGLAIHPNGGEIDTFTITAVAGDNRTERWGTLDRWWSYDKLFIYVKSGLSANVKIAYDTVEKPDQYRLSSGKWIHTFSDNCRLWIRAEYAGLTVGDIPVCGTINNIEIPSQSQTRLYAENNALPLAETTLKTIEGAGRCDYMLFHIKAKADSHNAIVFVYTDGNLAFKSNFTTLDSRGYGTSTPTVTLTKYADDGECNLQLTIPFSFKRKLELKMSAIVTADQDVYCDGVVNLIT